MNNKDIFVELSMRSGYEIVIPGIGKLYPGGKIITTLDIYIKYKKIISRYRNIDVAFKRLNPDNLIGGRRKEIVYIPSKIILEDLNKLNVKEVTLDDVKKELELYEEMKSKGTNNKANIFLLIPGISDEEANKLAKMYDSIEELIDAYKEDANEVEKNVSSNVVAFIKEVIDHGTETVTGKVLTEEQMAEYNKLMDINGIGHETALLLISNGITYSALEELILNEDYEKLMEIGVRKTSIGRIKKNFIK